VSTTATTVVLLENSIDLRSGERNEVIRVQLEGVSDLTEEENREPTTSYGRFYAVVCLPFFIGIQNCLSLNKSVLMKQ
jgi:hypothetical protein